MALSILHNIPSLEAQNQLSMTSTNLQNTLFQLSSGSKINSGADDPAGLSIADGLQANISALTQSAQNVTDGVGLLQTADGALSQVTTLLNRAVTLATEAGNAGLTGDQQTALQNEFTSITAEINQIGSNTTYNNTAVFSGSQLSVFLSDGSGADSQDPTIAVNMPTLSSAALGLASYASGTLDLTTNPVAGNTVTLGSQTYTFVSGAASTANQVQIGTTNGVANIQQTLQNLQAAVNGGAGAGTVYGAGTAVNQQATITAVNGGSAEVQALQAGSAGNDVTLATNLVSTTGGQISGSFLSGGTNVTADAGTLTLNAQPGYLSTATGTITMSQQPDIATNASGLLSFLNSSGTATQPVAGNATGTMDFGAGAGTMPTDGDKVGIGGTTYTFTSTLASGAAGDVKIAAGNLQATLQNLQAAVNGTGTAGTQYFTGTAKAGNAVISSVTAGTGGDFVLNVSSTALGAAGNNVNLTTSNGADVTLSGASLTGGTTSDTVTVGAQTYTFVAANAATAANEVALGFGGNTAANVQTTLTNLMDAVNGTGTGTAATYGAGTTAAGTAAMTLSGTQGEAILTATTAGQGDGSTTGDSVAFKASITGLANAANPTGTPGYLSGGNNADTVAIGGTTYTFVAQGQAVGADQVALGADAGTTLQNLKDAVNAIAAVQSNNTYGAGTVANGVAMISSIDTNTNTATVEAASGGTAFSGVGDGATTGNSVGLSTSSPVGAISVSGANLTGGANTDTVTIGDVVYSFVKSGQATSGNEVAVGNTVQDTLNNLKAAVNAATTGAGSNGSYYVSNLQGAGGATMSVTGSTATVTANTPGILTNGIALAGDFGAGNATATFGGTTVATLGGGTATQAATGMIQLSGQPTAGNATGWLNLGTNASALVGKKVTIEGTDYNFVAANGANAAGQVSIGSNGMASALANLQNAVNGTGTQNSNTYDAPGANQTSAVVSSFNASTGVVNISATSLTAATGDAVTIGATTGTNSGATLANGANSDTLTVGAQTYTFVAQNAAVGGNEVALGSDLQATLGNLMAAVNSTNVSNGAAATYHLGAGNLQGAGGASISSIYGGQAEVTANTAGTAGNALALSGTGTIQNDVFGTPGGTAPANFAAGYLAINSLPVAGNSVAIGNQTYTFANSPAAANQVAIGGSIASALANLKAAVNGGAGAGTAYGTGTVQNTMAQLGAITGDQVAVTALTAGAGTQGAGSGNYIAISVNLGSATAGGAVSTPTTLSGGSATTKATGTLDLVNNLGQGSVVTMGDQNYTFVNSTPTAANQVLLGQTSQDTLQNLEAAVNGTAGAGTTYGTNTSKNDEVSITNVNGNQATVTANNVGTAGNSYAILIGNTLGGGGSSVDLNSANDAQTALTTIASAIATVAAQRGAIGSGINQMNAAVNVMNNTSQNLTSSLSGIQDANIGQVVANMSKFQVLEQTGIAALAQANSQEQAVLKLLG